MSRRTYKTVNLPLELACWMDQVLADESPNGIARALGVHSRDEFVRVAVAVLALGCGRSHFDLPPLAAISEVVARLRQG
jgi:hypothetical protein